MKNYHLGDIAYRHYSMYVTFNEDGTARIFSSEKIDEEEIVSMIVDILNRNHYHVYSYTWDYSETEFIIDAVESQVNDLKTVFEDEVVPEVDDYWLDKEQDPPEDCGDDEFFD